MRHKKNRHKIGRGRGHRKRTLAALSSALIEHKRIRTTEAKAKALRPFVEPLITRAKVDTTHNRRQVFRKLQDKAAVDELFTDVAVEVGNRPGGYTRVIKLGRRSGDGAEMAMVELVDFNDVQPETGGSTRRSRTRRGGGQGRRKETADDQKQSAESSKKATPASKTTKTTDQVESMGQTETASVDESVAPEQTEPVPQRTDKHAEAREQAEAKKAEQAEEENEESEEDEDNEEKK